MMRIVLLILLLATLTGCPPRQTTAGRPPYDGPTQPVWEVAKSINSNASKVQTIWARHDFEALIYDDKGKGHSLSGSGQLQFRKPGDLLLKAGGVIDYFEAGANNEHFWFTVYPKEVGTQWWGRKDQLTAEGARQIPIRPDLLLEVLGVYEVEEDFTQPPVPTMRVNNDQWAYMFVWNAPMRTPVARWVSVKEVWYDIETKLPKLILLFDNNGRVILRAYPSEHKKMEGGDGVVATKYDLFFPENKSRMTFRLTSLMAEFKRGPVRFPNDATFAFPEDPGVEKRVQIR